MASLRRRRTDGVEQPAAKPGMILREDNGVSTLQPVHPRLPKRLEGKPLPKITAAQVAEHSTVEDCWIIIDERAYDITSFILAHPGGVGPVLNMAGKDASDVFANYHSARVTRTMLPAYLVGEVTDIVVEPHVADFRNLRQEMLCEGLFETNYVFYAKLCTWMVSLFICSVALSIGAIGGGAMWARLPDGPFGRLVEKRPQYTPCCLQRCRA